MTKKKGLKPERPDSEIQFKFWLSHFLRWLGQVTPLSGVSIAPFAPREPLCAVLREMCAESTTSGQLFSEQPVEQASVQGAQGPSGARANHWN